MTQEHSPRSSFRGLTSWEEGQDGVLLDPCGALLLDVFFWQLLSSTWLADLSQVLSLDIKPTAGRYWGQLLDHLHSGQGPSYPQTPDASRKESRGEWVPRLYLDGPRETESPDFLDCTLIDGLPCLLPVVSPTDRERCDGGTWKWVSAWNVVRPTVRGPPRGRRGVKRRCRSGLAHTALCESENGFLA